MATEEPGAVERLHAGVAKEEEGVIIVYRPSDAEVGAACRAACITVELQVATMPDGFRAWERLGFKSVDAFVDAAWPNYAEQVTASLIAAHQVRSARDKRS